MEQYRPRAARGRNEEALACYDCALSLRRDIPQIWVNRGNALRDLVRLDEAEKSLREALRLKPDFANAHRELGNVLDYLGRFEEAEASVRTALHLQPEETIVAARSLSTRWRRLAKYRGYNLSRCKKVRRLPMRLDRCRAWSCTISQRISMTLPTRRLS